MIVAGLASIRTVNLSPRVGTFCSCSAQSRQGLSWIPVPSACPVPPLCQLSRPFHTSLRNLSYQKPPRFAYRVAASSSGKGRSFSPSKNLYPFDPLRPPYALGLEQKYGNKIPKRKNRPDSGQDAFFVAQVSSAASSNPHTTVAFGIADGVGGWANSGVDPADFSHGLCSYMAKIARTWPHAEQSSLKVRDLMEMGFQAVIDDPSVSGGGSTACVAIARTEGNLEVANLGDSGYVQLRANAIHHYSNPQTHAFNTPYQLSIIPPKVLAQSAIFGGTPLSDLPRDSTVAHHGLQHGDVILLATDGVWDNLYPQDVLRIVSRHMTTSGAWESVSDQGIVATSRIDYLTEPGGVEGPDDESTLQGLVALEVVGAAKQASLNTKVDGPFAREVRKYYPEDDYHGGKVDDVCVVVAVVVEEGSGTV
jgi:protein phosphatase PTC7